MKFNALIPELSVSDLAKSKRFYLDLLGFHLNYERPEDGFVFLSFGEAQLLLEQINDHWETGELVPPFGRGINFQIEAPDVTQLRERLVANKLPLFRDVYETTYRENDTLHKVRELLVQDPDGYLLRFSQTL